MDKGKKIINTDKFIREERSDKDGTNKVISKVKTNQRDYDNPTLKQAMERDDWGKWKEAKDDEYKQMYDEGVFNNKKIIEKGANIVGSMFTLTIKRDKTTGQIDKLINIRLDL